MSIGNGDLNGLTIEGCMSIRCSDNRYVDITVADTYAALTNLHKVKENLITVNETLGKWTLQIDGSYIFNGVASVKTNIGALIHFAVFVNGNIEYDIETSLDFKNSQDANTFAGLGPLDLKKGDTIEVKGKSDIAPVRLYIHHLNVNLFRIGH